jgi:ribosomal protein S18 acetylase RimI-like enzyme
MPVTEPAFLDKVLVTERRPDDRNFVFDTWARAFRVAPACKSTPTSAYHPWQRARMERILSRPSTLVLVARDSEREVFIHGYGVFERFDDAFVAHWVYVKNNDVSRRQGVASLLLARALDRIGEGSHELLYTHRTYFADKAESLGFQFVKLEDLERRIAEHESEVA